MGYNKSFIKLKVYSKLNNTFIGIIRDIPSPDLKQGNNTLFVQQKSGLMSYEQFYNIIYRIVSEYVPAENENPLFKAIMMFPKAMKNARRIKQNNEIIKVQRDILERYFYTLGNDNIKIKLSELEKEIDLLICENEFEILDLVLARFDERMRSGLLADLEHLSQLLEKRE